MNVDVPLADARLIEVVANGLSLWNGAQLAVDAQPGADVRPGQAVDAAVRRKRQQTYPELARARRCRLVVVGVEVGTSSPARSSRGAPPFSMRFPLEVGRSTVPCSAPGH